MLSSQKNKPLFLVFEGGEGTGKTTQIQELRKKLESVSKQVQVTFEPGGTELGQKVRELLLNPSGPSISSRTEALLLAASRAQHVEQVIRPALSKGTIVLCDRYWDASIAYQGVGRGLGIEAILNLNLWATESLYPDHVFVFDLDPSIGLKRAKDRAQGAVMDRIEQEALVFHQNVRKGYLQALKLFPETHTLVDASQNVGDISKQIWNRVEPLLV
jgi:dTMP kinase